MHTRSALGLLCTLAVMSVGMLSLTRGCGGSPGDMPSSPRSDGKIALAAQSSAVVDDAGRNTDRTLTTPARLLSPDEEFRLAISLNDRTGVAGFFLRADFDKAVFACSGVTLGDQVPATAHVATNVPDAAGTACVAAASTSAVPSGPGIIATLQMRVLQSATPQNARMTLTVTLCDARGKTLGRVASHGAAKSTSGALRPAQANLIGDLLSTGSPEVGSAIKILRVVVALDPQPAASDLWRWDCDASGAVDVGDAIKVLRCVVLLDPWPIVAPQEYVLWRYPGGDAKPPVLAFSTPPKPARGVALNDPVYHTQLVRATDKAADQYQSPGLVNEYARVDPESADGSRALLRGTEGDWHLYSLPGYQHIRQVPFRGNPDPEPRWDVTNPNVVYFVDGPSLWQYNVATQQEALIHDFTPDQPGVVFARSRYEGEPSADRRYWCLRLEDGDYRLLSIVCYDREANQVVGRLTNLTDDPDWVSMDMGGTHCVLAAGDVSDAVSYHRDFSHPIRLPHGIGHADMALTAGGGDVLVYQNAATDWIAMADLETGVETNLLPIPFNDNLDIGLHFSGNSYDKRGWVLVSTYGQQTTAKSWMDQSLFMVQLQAHPLVWRIAQTCCLQDPSLEKDYFGEAFAAINQRGTHVWWGSNWNVTGAGNHQYETYVANFPSDWDTQILALSP